MNEINTKVSLETFKNSFDEIGESTQKKAKSFHNKYISKVTPNFGKYGDQAKFVAEMLPGIEEYNAVREGDWNKLAIATSIDVGSLAVGTVSAGTGYFAMKGGTTAAKLATKEIIKETAEKGTKKIVKETVVKSSKEVMETAVKKSTKELAENTAEKSVKKESVTLLKKIDKTPIKGEVDTESKINNLYSGIDKINDKLRGVKLVKVGQHYTTDTNGIKKLKNSVRYITENGHIYVTDKLGRITNVKVKKLELLDGRRNTYAQRTLEKDLGDDAGHLIANIFGGSGWKDNLVPMLSKINRAGGEWYEMEQNWINALREGKKVKAKIRINYSNRSTRPDKFEINYFIDGKRFKKIIDNI